MKVVVKYAGAVSAFFGAILLLIGWVRHRDALDFLFHLLLRGRISEDWDAAAFLVGGLLLFAFAAYSGVLGPHKNENQE
jgi:hypothetical protein